MPEPTREYRLYSSTEGWVGKVHAMTDRMAKILNDAMPKWSSMRWKKVKTDG